MLLQAAFSFWISDVLAIWSGHHQREWLTKMREKPVGNCGETECKTHVRTLPNLYINDFTSFICIPVHHAVGSPCM